MHQEPKMSPCDSQPLFVFLVHSHRLTADMPRHLGLTHTFQVSSMAHTQEKQLKCTVRKETSLIHQPQRTSFSLANTRLPMGMESHFVNAA